jgi:hypothetical protein
VQGWWFGNGPYLGPDVRCSCRGSHLSLVKLDEVMAGARPSTTGCRIEKAPFYGTQDAATL